MKGLIGKKLGMTQFFTEDGQAVPVTVLDVSPSTVLQVKTTKKDGYEAIQVGYGQRKIHRASKAERVRAEKAGLESAPVRVQEFRTPDATRFQVGDRIGVDFFRVGDKVKVIGRTKGRGFTGVVKRWNFGGGTRKSHGGGPLHRGAGSVGSSADPSRTMKGRALPGHYGDERCTIRNLIVIGLDGEHSLLYLKGAVPGPANGLVTIELIASEPRAYEPAGRRQEAAPAGEVQGPEEAGVVTAEQESES